jgi:hypothetical protein
MVLEKCTRNVPPTLTAACSRLANLTLRKWGFASLKLAVAWQWKIDLRLFQHLKSTVIICISPRMMFIRSRITKVPL